jgi:hypothetical protein
MAPGNGMLEWNWIDDTRAHDLHERADLVDIRTWQTLKRTSRIAVADGTEKVRLDLAARAEFSIDSLIVEPGHRSAVEPMARAAMMK